MIADEISFGCRQYRFINGNIVRLYKQNNFVLNTHQGRYTLVIE